jgi:hypothetical protein
MGGSCDGTQRALRDGVTVVWGAEVVVRELDNPFGRKRRSSSPAEPEQESGSRHETMPEIPAVIGPSHSQDLSLASIPVVALPLDRVRELPLDARQGFVLSLVDGECSLEQIIDMCAFERIETIEIIAGFIQGGLVAMMPPAPASKPPSGRRGP